MHKNTLWFIVAILCIYFSLVFCEESTAIKELESKDSHDVLRSDSTALEEEGRTRRRHRHHLYSLWGFYGLAIAYLVKIKVIVVAFFVGSAVYLGLRYLWPHKCGGIGGIYKEGPIILDHPPSFEHHHDHIPYSLEHDHYHDHNFDTSSFSSHSGPSWSSSGPSWSGSGPSSFEPYSAYSSHSFSESEGPDGPDGPPGPPDSISSDSPTFRRKRSVSKYKTDDDKQGSGTLENNSQDDNQTVTGTFENLARQMVITEERIGEFMFNFLGLDTTACRRRFICEMEFKSKLNPLTSMAFRIIGRSFFAKYTNDQNPFKRAQKFSECAAVNSECVFIENNEDLVQEPTTEAQQVNQNETDVVAQEQESNDDRTQTTTEDNSLESNDIIEKENEQNLIAELRENSYRRRLRGDRYLKLI